MAQYDVDLREYWRVVGKRKAVILAMVVVAAACSYGFARLREPAPLYEAHSALKIDRFANLALVFTGGYWRQSENIDTHAYIITSFPVLAMTAQDLGWIPRAASEEDIRRRPEHLAALQRLKDIVEAEPEEGTNIINIRVVSEKADEAAEVANALANAYRAYNIRHKNKKTFETKAFIEAQLSATSEKLRRAEQRLQAFEEENGLVAVDAQTRNTLEKQYALETEYERTRQERVEIESHLADIRAGRGRAALLKASGFASPEGSPLNRLKARLSELNIERQTLLISLTPRHPEVRKVDDQIKAVLKEISGELQSLVDAYRDREADLHRRLEQLRRENLRLPEKSLQLVRLKREVQLQEALYSQLKEKYQETLIQESGRMEEVSLVKPAVAPAKPFNIPSRMLVVSTGATLGLILGLLLAFLVEMFDTSVGSVEEVEELLRLPVLGIIPHLWPEAGGRKGKRRREAPSRRQDLVTHHAPQSVGAEAFRALRTNLQFLRLGSQGRVFMVTSADVQEGKTFSAVNLALNLAQAGHRVLLVDGDLRRPQVHEVFGLRREPGITDVVLGNCRWREAANTISDVMLGEFQLDDILKTPGLDNLHVMCAGLLPPNPTEVLNSERFAELLREARAAYDFVFIDTPPVLPVADAAELAPLAEGVFLVCTAGKVGRRVLRRAKSTLDNVEAKILGVILNRARPDGGPKYYRYYQHYYQQEPGPEKAQPGPQPSAANPAAGQAAAGV